MFVGSSDDKMNASAILASGVIHRGHNMHTVLALHERARY